MVRTEMVREKETEEERVRVYVWRDDVICHLPGDILSLSLCVVSQRLTLLLSLHTLLVIFPLSLFFSPSLFPSRSPL